MPIACHSSNLSSDIRCAICGQGFLLYADGEARGHLQEVKQDVQRILRHHHTMGAHPAGTFTVDFCPDQAPSAGA